MNLTRICIELLLSGVFLNVSDIQLADGIVKFFCILLIFCVPILSTTEKRALKSQFMHLAFQFCHFCIVF